MRLIDLSLPLATVLKLRVWKKLHDDGTKIGFFYVKDWSTCLLSAIAPAFAERDTSTVSISYGMDGVMDGRIACPRASAPFPLCALRACFYGLAQIFELGGVFETKDNAKSKRAVSMLAQASLLQSRNEEEEKPSAILTFLDENSSVRCSASDPSMRLTYRRTFSLRLLLPILDDEADNLDGRSSRVFFINQTSTRGDIASVPGERSRWDQGKLLDGKGP
ncbi:hypothetical protein ABW21_db0207293 [Orbilia brochopaga]|nr:hypothetical protein ABW21_db0207293 [Drechslerella brochopaga]